MYRKLASVVLVAAAINAKYAVALGLGEMTMHSALNQPLSAEIKLTNVGDLDETQILVSLAAESEFEKAGVDRNFFLTGMKFEVLLDESGDSVIKLRSDKSVKEPFLDFLLEAKWPAGRVVKSYTALIDLPIYTDDVSETVDLSSSGKAVNAPRQVTDSQASTSSVESGTEGAYIEEATVAAVSVAEPQSSYAEDTYTIQRGDTMYKVAKSIRPESNLSVEQTLLALQQENPKAFIGGNINRVKAGAVLRIPTIESIRENSSRSAIAAIGQQNREWREAQLESSDDHYTPVQPDRAKEGHLSLAAAGTGLADGSDADGSATGAAGAAGVSAEELEVAHQENQELQGRLQSLGGQVEDLQRMIELKDAELASLQQKLSQRSEEVIESSDSGQAVEDVADAKALTDVVADEAVATDEPADVVSVESDSIDSENIEDEASIDEPAVVQKPAVEIDPSKTIVAQLMANPMYIGGVGLLIAVIVLMLIMRRRGKAEQAAIDAMSNFEFEDSADEAELSSDDVVDQDTVDQNTVDQNDIDQSVLEQDLDLPLEDSIAEEFVEEAEKPTVMQTDDAIGEADIYIAYGRYDQAVELLEGAITSAPQDVALRRKLIEVHIESSNKDGFQQQFAEFQNLADDDAVIHIKEFLSVSGDKSDWLNGVNDASVVAETIDDLESLGADLSLDDSDLSLDDSELSLDDSELSLDDSELSLGDSELSLDDSDLSLDDSDLSLDDSDLSLGDSGLSLDDSDLGLEPDLSFDESDFGLTDENADTSLDQDGLSLDVDSDNGLQADDDLSGIDLSLDLESDLTAETEASDEELSLDLGAFDETLLDVPAVSAEDTELDLDDLDLGIDLDLSEEAADVEVAVEDELSLDADFDLSLDDNLDLSINVEDETPVDVEGGAPVDLDLTVDEEPLVEGEADISALSTLEGDDLAFLTDADEVSTKLDLARAYVDMGDVDGARDILMEVMKEGDEAQKSEATTLIDGLD